MYLIKSSVKNIFHNKTRYVINAVLLLIVISVCSYAFFVFEACKKTTDDINSKFTNRYTFSLYYFGTQSTSQIPIDKNTMNDFFKSKYIDKTVISFKANHVSLDGIVKFDNTPESEQGSGNPYHVGQFVIEGWNTSELSDIDEFDMGIMELTEGRTFQNYGEIIINDDLAKKNNLTIGDIVSASSYSGYDSQYTIVGLYKLRNDIYYFDTGIGIRNIDVDEINYDTRNLIYSSFDTAYDITSRNTIYDDNYNADQKEDAFYNTPPTYENYYPIFTLNSNDLSYVKEFENELHKKGLLDDISIMYDRTSSEGITRTLDVLSSSLFIIYVIFSFIGIVITFFSIVISLRERKYEFAVLSSMGMSKTKICISLCIETFVFLIAITLTSVFIGRLFAIHIVNAFNPELLLWFDITIVFSTLFTTAFVLYVIFLGLMASILYGVYLYRFSPFKLFVDRF